MKDDLLVIGIVGFGAWLMLKSTGVTTAVTTVIDKVSQAVAGSGAAVYSLVHDTTPTEDMINGFPNAVYADYDGTIFDAQGALIGYETDDYWIRDAGGRRVWQSSFWRSKPWSFHFANYAGVVQGGGATGSW